jgi:hypothetical protein
MPTLRSGHGGVFYNGKLFCMGGEVTRRVFGELEAYDPRADSWQAYAPAPRHGMGAAVLSDGIHVAGGGPMNGGAFQTSYTRYSRFDRAPTSILRHLMRLPVRPAATAASGLLRLLTAVIGPSAKFLAHAKKSLVTGAMRTRFAYVVFFA